MDDAQFLESSIPEPMSGCHLWLKAASPLGYGRVYVPHRHHHKIQQAHRIAVEISSGAIIPKGLHVLHKCDNPYCVNPQHLLIGTPLDNKRDCINKGRFRHGVSIGEKHGGAKLTEKQVVEMRDRARQGEPIKTLARLFGLTNRPVQFAIRGRTWSHLNERCPPVLVKFSQAAQQLKGIALAKAQGRYAEGIALRRNRRQARRT